MVDQTSLNSLPSISIIIPIRDQVELLKLCINSLLDKTDYPLSAIEIIIINNQSKLVETKHYLSELSLLSYVQVINFDYPFNFSAMNNLAAKAANNEVLCLLNNDIEVISTNWLREMTHFLSRDDIGCVGAKLYYPDNTIQHAGVVLGINGVAGHVYKHSARDCKGYDNHLVKVRYYSAVTAACMLVKKTVYLAAGGFDENLAVAYNDVDFCLSLGNLGYKHVWTPRAELYHHESVSRGSHKQRTRYQQRQFKKEVGYMTKKWGGRLLNDPAWNTNWPLNETWNGELITNESPVYIVLASYNGVDHIAKQLDSLLAQSWPCQIYIFDDGSTDGTIELIQNNYLKYKNIKLSFNVERLGYVKNFEQGIKTVYDCGAKYIALCDQDDIWHHQRIEKMGTILLSAKKNTPTLVYSDLEMMDNNGNITHSSYLQYRNYRIRSKNTPESLAIALGQNGVMGNTILMNRDLARKVLPFPDKLHAHDYWISLVAQLSGECIFVAEPLVSYRIHTNNSSNSLQTLGSLKPKNPRKLYDFFLQRDYRLPHKEDSRGQILEHSLNKIEIPLASLSGSKKEAAEKVNHLFSNISDENKRVIKGFLHYLNFDKPRWYLCYWMIHNGFIRTGFRHKLRFIYRVLVTTRYN